MALQVAGIAEDHARRLFQEMVTAVDYCHRLGIVNRDIKLDNLMLDTSAEPTLRVCDFGALPPPGHIDRLTTPVSVKQQQLAGLSSKLSSRWRRVQQGRGWSVHLQVHLRHPG